MHKVELTTGELEMLVHIARNSMARETEPIENLSRAFDKLTLALDTKPIAKREWLIQDADDGALLNRQWDWVGAISDNTLWTLSEAQEIIADSTGNLVMKRLLCSTNKETS